mmetsp:Transcript_90914/g.257392  ORF Transcript_90914/g.257392 Transcript_90914/m.257392 type:complete len:218 (-) Transcript_90914:166-819(-)
MSWARTFATRCCGPADCGSVGMRVRGWSNPGSVGGRRPPTLAPDEAVVRFAPVPDLVWGSGFWCSIRRPKSPAHRHAWAQQLECIIENLPTKHDYTATILGSPVESSPLSAPVAAPLCVEALDARCSMRPSSWPSTQLSMVLVVRMRLDLPTPLPSLRTLGLLRPTLVRQIFSTRANFESSWTLSLTRPCFGAGLGASAPEGSATTAGAMSKDEPPW